MSKEYRNYLNEHIGNVRKAFDWLKKNIATTEQIPLTEYDWRQAERHIKYHDDTKWTPSEWNAYDVYYLMSLMEDQTNCIVYAPACGRCGKFIQKDVSYSPRDYIKSGFGRFCIGYQINPYKCPHCGNEFTGVAFFPPKVKEYYT